jgi:hypothetical protein
MLVLEAQHIGVPVITTRRGAMKDYTMHGAIPASRRVDSRHLHESSPGMMEVGGFFFDFEAPRRRLRQAGPTRVAQHRLRRDT